MTGQINMRQSSGVTRRAWLGAALTVTLLLAETLALTHPLDSAAHTNGQPCSICFSVATVGAGAVSTPTPIHVDAATPSLVAVVASALVSSPVQRRFARGPPAVSFAF